MLTDRKKWLRIVGSKQHPRTWLMKKPWFSKRIIFYETIGWLLIILIIWLDEILDIPHHLFGARQTPINWIESIFETITISLGWIIIVYLTNKLLNKIRHLEGFLPICSSCKKIRDNNGCWNQMESYIRDHSEAEFSHGICPECAKKLYPEYFEGQNDLPR